MLVRKDVKILVTFVALAMAAGCGKSKVKLLASTAPTSQKSGVIASDSVPAQGKTNLPSDEELDKLIDIVQDVNVDDIADQFSHIENEEDNSSIPGEIYKPAPTPEKPVEKEAPPVTEPAPQPSETATKEDPPAPKPPAPPTAPSGAKESLPSLAKNQAFDFPNQGYLRNSSSLLERRLSYSQNSPFELSQRAVDQGRFFATDDLVNFIDFISNYFRSVMPERKLLVSDLSKKQGGPIWRLADVTHKVLYRDGKPLLSHLSHQNGIDADIAYITSGAQDKFFSLNTISAKKSVNLEVQFNVFKQAVSSKMVDFILIHPSLKKELCIAAYKEGALEKDAGESLTLETLKRLVPDPAHHDHFHLRIKCDEKIQPKCLSRERPAINHGCIIKS
jgi:penicillin-insensitive murein endopeptidase